MFAAPKLTDAGKALYYANMAGEQIKFTTIQLGSGYLSGPIATLTALVSPVVTITAAVAVYDDYVDISGTFSNAELSEGFYWREIGVFAVDPDYPDDRSKDILYCYQNAYDTADYMPVATVETVEKSITVPVIVGDAASVSCTLASSLIYVSQQDLDNHNASETAHPDIREAINNIPKRVFYGACSTVGATAEKAASIIGFAASDLTTGVIVGVTFTEANTNTAATLNVAATGAKPVRALGVAPLAGQIGSGMLAFFQYDGTYWVHLNPIPVDKLSLGGGTMTGALTLSSDPTADLHAATKHYVDSDISAHNNNTGAHADKLSKSGGTMTGALTLSGAPTADLHAATKKYVDGKAVHLVELTRFTTSGTFTPANFPSVGNLYLIMILGAGGGVYYSSGEYDGGGGAGAMQYIDFFYAPGMIKSTFDVVIGAFSATSNGGTTSFDGFIAPGGGAATSGQSSGAGKGGSTGSFTGESGTFSHGGSSLFGNGATSSAVATGYGAGACAFNSATYNAGTGGLAIIYGYANN